MTTLIDIRLTLFLFNYTDAGSFCINVSPKPRRRRLTGLMGSSQLDVWQVVTLLKATQSVAQQPSAQLTVIYCNHDANTCR